MSHRQSCDRCRQQKVRCLRDESQNGESKLASSGRPAISRCERCRKAGVDCVYSLVKQRSNRSSAQASNRRSTEPKLANSSDAAWLEQSQTGGMYLGGPSLGTDFADLVGGFPTMDENGSIHATDFNGWDTNLQQFSPNSLNSLSSLTASSAADAAHISTAPSTPDDRDDISDMDYDQHSTDALTTQLTSLSQRATRAMRRLSQAGCAPLTVSAPEVNEALEDTNTLIRIMNNITSSDRDDDASNDCGLAFSALACHQHLMSLFRAICDGIHRCLQSKKEQHQQQQFQQNQCSNNNFGPSSVAQFVMVLQLLMHLINRMDRSLFQNPITSSSAVKQGTAMMGGYITPITPESLELNLMQCETPSATGGVLKMVQDVVGSIPAEHEKLRLIIQQLQTETEFSELH